MSEPVTTVLKPPRQARPKPTGTTGTGAKPPTPPKVWPEVFEIENAKKMFAPVEDTVSLQALYELWRMALGHQADANQIAACSKLIEHRIGRAYQKSPLGATELDGVEINYIEPEEGDAGA